MTKKGLQVVLEAARTIQQSAPEIFSPIAEFFDVDIQGRLSNEATWKDLCYEGY